MSLNTWTVCHKTDRGLKCLKFTTSPWTSLPSILTTTPIVKVSDTSLSAPQFSWPKYRLPPVPRYSRLRSLQQLSPSLTPFQDRSLSAPVSPSLSCASLSGVTSPSSLPTELSLPTSWADWSPSPIDYEGISEWAEEAAEADPPALPHFTVFHRGINNPEAPFIVENPASAAEPAPAAAPEVFVGPLEFTFPAVEPVQSPPAEQSPPSQSMPRPVFEEPLLPTPQLPAPASPRPLSPLPVLECGPITLRR